MKLINIGFGNMVNANRLISIVSPDSAPIKRLVQESRDKGALIDSDHVILSALQPETLAGRVEGDTSAAEEELEDEE